MPVHVLFHVCMCVSISMQNSAHQHPLPLSIFLEFMHTFAHLVLLLSYQPLPSLFLHDLIPAHTHPPTRPLLWLTPSSFLYLPQQHLNNRSKSSLHHRSLPPFLLYVSFLHTRSPTNQAPQPVDPGSKAPRRQKQTRY